ncbi:MAG: penicillin-binding protein 2 [Coriobacteriales bacterium]|jgi:penicillin-binding protein 2|nr:penicillin-binding protein 2 [Coriobacteriales bacterium]
MGGYGFALAAGIGAALIVAGILAVVYWRSQRRSKEQAVTPSFERADAQLVKDEERFTRRELSGKQKGLETKGRFYAFGVLVAAVFGTLAVRLWALQVLSGEEYTARATDNMTTEVSVPAMRGRILDRNGVVLVTNRPTSVLSGKRALAEDRGLVHRLSLACGIPKGIVRRNLLDDTTGAQSDHVIAADVPYRVVAYITEHPLLFRGINVETRTMRHYPYGSLGAHVLGYTGSVSQADMDAAMMDPSAIQYENGDSKGQMGAELAFERALQGTRGTRSYQVDSSGNPLALLGERESATGSDVCLTIDMPLQRETDRILAQTIAAAKEGDYPEANAGALVCIDITDGGILASSSYPTFNPADLSGSITQGIWDQLNSEDANRPLYNRVISGAYPAASTFKAFTSLAGLHHGIIGPDTSHHCNGWWNRYGDEWGKRCWIFPNGHGTLGLEEAINHSCDVFFYNTGTDFWEIWNATPSSERKDVFQEYLRGWGFGSQSGIDLVGEFAGVVPDAAWKKAAFPDTPEDARWLAGDMANMVIGQGDLLVTPLQIANAYATLARGHALVPHVFHKVVDKDGNTVRAHAPATGPIQPVYEPHHRERVIDGLRRVIMREGVFAPIPVELAGKSGTAEVAGKGEYSWFVAYGPMTDPHYSVACIVEQGGGGSSTAITGVLHTFAAIYGVDVGEILTYEATGER